MGRDKDFVVGALDATSLTLGGTSGPNGTSGTLVTSTGAEMDQFVMNVVDQDVSTASSLWVVSPYAGIIVSMHTTISGTIATAPWVVTAELAGTAVTGISCSIAHGSSAAGDVASSTATALNVVTAGQVIEIVSAGASTNTILGTITLVLQRT